jgi:hypothetical protein
LYVALKRYNYLFLKFVKIETQKYKDMIRTKILTTITFFLIFCFSCKKEENTNTPLESERTTAIQSASAGWTLEMYTKPDNTLLDPNRVTGDSKYVNQQIYVFDKSGNVKSYDKISKVALTYGTWKFTTNDTILETLINGQVGVFNVVELTKTKMILKTDNFEYDKAKISVHMVFLPLQ